MLTNESPRLADSSGARLALILVTRMLFDRSENSRPTAELLTELPGSSTER